MFLSQLGAEVIKIESLDGDPFRLLGYGFMGWNQNKRDICIDLNTAEGREIAHALVKQADVLVENLRLGRSRKLGIDYETLSAINPRLVYMTVTGFGTSGPQADRPGFDPLAQAMSGVMHAHGGYGREDLPGDPKHPLFMTCAPGDYGAAMLSALGCVLALRARQVDGLGQRCETSLIEAAIALQAGEYVFYPGRPNFENGAPELRGLSALHRAYECQDEKWIYISISTPQVWDSLRGRVAGFAQTPFEQAVSEPPYGLLAEALAEFFSARTAQAATEQVSAIGGHIVPVNHLAELFSDPHMIANELLTELEHPQWGMVGQVGMMARFSATPGRITRPAPLLGQHTDEILTEFLGYDTARIKALRTKGVIR